MQLSEMCVAGCVGLPAPAPACMCGIEGSSTPNPSLCVKRNRIWGSPRSSNHEVESLPKLCDGKFVTGGQHADSLDLMSDHRRTLNVRPQLRRRDKFGEEIANLG